MKKILTLLIVTMFTVSLFSQQINKKVGKVGNGKIDFEKQYYKLIVQNDQLQKSSKELSGKLKKYQRQLPILNAENAKLKTEKAKLKISNNTLNVQVKGFQTINSNLNTQISDLKKKDSDNQLKMAKLIIGSQKVNGEKERFKNQIVALKSLTSSLKNNIKDLNNVVAQKDVVISKLKDERANLKIELGTKDKLKAQYLEMSALRNKANMIISNLQEKNKKLKNENFLVKSQLDKFKRGVAFNKKLQEENATMKEKIEKLSDTNNILKDYNKRLKARTAKKLGKK